MRFVLALGLYLTASLVWTSTILQETISPDYRDRKVKALVATVDYFESLFWTQYAPFRWKQLYWKWDPQTESTRIKNIMIASQGHSFSESKRAFNYYLGTCRDAHVGIHYSDARAAYIPIKTDWIDHKVLVTSSAFYALQPGDEIVSINGLPVLDYFSQQIYAANAKQAPLNRLPLNIFRLFTRIGALDALPEQKSISITVKKPDSSSLQTLQTEWNFIDNIDQYLNKKPKAAADSHSLNAKFRAYHDFSTPYLPDSYHFEALVHADQNLIHSSDDGHSMNEQGFKNSSSSSFAPFWKIYELEGKKLGYLRIPNFMDDQLIAVTRQAVIAMQETTEGLIVDLRDNSGGSLFMCWGVLSMLTDKPLSNPVGSEILDEDIIADYTQLVAEINEILSNVTSDEQLQSMIDDEEYPWTLEKLRSFHGFLTSAIEEWNAGYTCTRFMPMLGQSFVQPHPSVHYTKPIFALINEKAASCGDIFPAILQDNQRAILLGNTTTGAGGYVKQYIFPNFTGIKSFSLTRSLLMRNNQRVIEDLGVSPDYEYKRSLQDAMHPELELKRALVFALDKLK